MNEPVPTKLSVVLPMKIEEWSENLPLQNNFSVGILPLCISQINGKQFADPRENSQLLERLDAIKRANDSLRKSPDYKVNFLVMKYLTAVLPDKFLRPIFRSYSTMVFSNLVGPQEVKLMGHPLKNIVFWIPNRLQVFLCHILPVLLYDVLVKKPYLKDWKYHSFQSYRFQELHGDWMFVVNLSGLSALIFDR